MDDLQKLMAIEAIKQLKARYFRCMDTKDWAGFESVFAADAEMDMSGEVRDGSSGDGRIRGAAEIAAYVRAAVDAVETVHHGHTPEIEILSPGSARGIWAMEDVLRWPPGNHLHSLQGYGHYHETYECRDGEWRIKTIRLSRLRVDVVLGE